MCSRIRLVIAMVVMLAAWSVAATAQSVRPDFVRIGAGKGVQVFHRSVSSAQEGDRAVARLDARQGDGAALIEGVHFSDGVIELDLRGKDVAQQSFVGVAFHWIDATTYDAVYFRPFNFQATGQEQRSHAVQYISHPTYTWQKLRAEKTGQFEKAIQPAPDPNAWFHARIVVAKGKVEVFVNNAPKPSLVVEDLGAAKSGGVALWVGNGSDGSFSNLTVTPATK